MRNHPGNGKKLVQNFHLPDRLIVQKSSHLTKKYLQKIKMKGACPAGKCRAVRLK